MNLDKFWNELSVWSQATFGSDSVRGPQGPLKHLKKEVEECLKNPSDIFEYADLLFLVFDSCRRAGFTYDELCTTVHAKLEINKNRRWGKPNENEAIEHIREDEDAQAKSFAKSSTIKD